MAKIGGRRAWLAWPSALICTGIVAALLWLALPGIPGAFVFAGDVLRMGSAASGGVAPTPSPTIGSVATTDCRSLYPDSLWSELTWTRHALLAQDTSAPQLSATGVTTALAPTVLLSCGWRSDSGSIATTLATIRSDAGTVAQASLAVQGFECQELTTGFRCSRAADGIDEDVEIRGDRWLTTRYDGWHPSAYGARVASRVWP